MCVFEALHVEDKVLESGGQFNFWQRGVDTPPPPLLCSWRANLLSGYAGTQPRNVYRPIRKTSVLFVTTMLWFSCGT